MLFSLQVNYSNQGTNDDDKFRKPIATNKQERVLVLLALTMEVASQILRFAGFVVVEVVVSRWAGLVFDWFRIERFVWTHLEVVGLLMLRHKIKARQSVAGLSGMTMIMYACVFFLRLVVPAMMRVQGWSRDIPCELSVGIFSFLLVLDILKAVFMTHRNTYQSDLDAMKVWYLIPVCCALTPLLHPNLGYYPSWWYDYVWTLNALMDMVALMPQVMMMSRGGGKVEAPIANFVAAVFISRCGDIVHSFVFDQDVLAISPFGFVFAVSSQLMQILLVTDFMYYYFKARSQSRSTTLTGKFGSEMTLPKEALSEMVEV